MNAGSAIGGWTCRVVGALLLTHWALVVLIKSTQGRAAELLWLSHVGLVLTGIALLAHAPRLARSVLTVIAIPHLLWLGDAAGLGLHGRSPLGITAYLATATPADWVATAHHFVLLPVLACYLSQRGGWRGQDVGRAWAGLVVLMLAGRLLGDSPSNVNYSYGLLGATRHPLLDMLNTAPPVAYLAITALTAVPLVILPGALLTRTLAMPGRTASPLRSGPTTAAPRGRVNKPREMAG